MTGPPKKTDGGMQYRPGIESIGLDPETVKTKSILELQNVDDFLLQADLANREFLSERENVVVVDATTQAYRPPSVQWADYKTDFVFQELCVPRRPAWDVSMSAQELDRQEQHAFLDWRRGIAAKEDELMRNTVSWNVTHVTPFEKNLEVWRQLWRVLERSSCLLQLVDARNPLFYLSDDLKDYAKTLGKPMMVLINKSDYLSQKQREQWKDYLTERGWEVLFFSAVQEQQKLDAAAQAERRKQQALDPRLDGSEDQDVSSDDEAEEDDPLYETAEEEKEEYDTVEEELSMDGIGVDVPLTRQQLLDHMMSFAAKHGCQPDPRYDNRIQFGMVGFPNVGKSSVINVCTGSSKHTHGLVRVGVASQPGKTKHFQTLLLPDRDDMMLCDCPGLVFPSFVSNTADLIAAGVYPIAQMRDHWPVVNLICQRIPREIINAQYGITLPVPTEMEMRERCLVNIPRPTAEDFLTTLCVARSMLAASSGVPDFTRAARMVIKDYAAGKLLYCHPPPSVYDIEEFGKETIATALRNTEKLRHKLERQQQALEPAHVSLAAIVAQPEDGMINEAEDDMLEFMNEQSMGRAAKQSMTEKRQHMQPKGGKKGKQKKNREKDPYGCHTSPDDLIMATYVSAGLQVKAGKYSESGYTRPSYVGPRNTHVSG
jgi:large subunit GTPase 1